MIFIRLKYDLPVSAAHGMTEGRILQVISEGNGSAKGVRWWVRSDADIEKYRKDIDENFNGLVGVLGLEAEIVTEEEYLVWKNENDT